MKFVAKTTDKFLWKIKYLFNNKATEADDCQEGWFFEWLGWCDELLKKSCPEQTPVRWLRVVLHKWYYSFIKKRKPINKTRFVMNYNTNYVTQFGEIFLLPLSYFFFWTVNVLGHTKTLSVGKGGFMKCKILYNRTKKRMFSLL
jgi:hypothetical protein